MNDNSIGGVCFLCGEMAASSRGDGQVPVWTRDGSKPMWRHAICAQRAVIGGVNHLLNQCTCCGGTQDPDPPGLSRYEAALVAVAVWDTLHRHERGRSKKNLDGEQA